MKTARLTLALVAAASLWPAVSQADLAFNVGAVSDYRYRGISQSRLKPALQGGLDFSAGGFYLGTWASTIKWVEDGNSKSSNKVEIDLYGGYKGDIVKDSLSYDVGVLAYQYPGHKAGAAGLTSPNTTEIYGALTFGPATLKYSHSVTNLFGFSDSKNSGYLDLSASFDVGGGVMLAPHLGYQKVSHNSNYSYTDVSLSVSKDFNGLVPSLTLYATDTKKPGGSYAYVSPAGKNLGRTGVVLGVKYNF